MQNVKWQAVIPAIIIALMRVFFLFKSNEADGEKAPQFKAISSEAPPSVNEPKKPTKEVDNDNKAEENDLPMTAKTHILKTKLIIRKSSQRSTSNQ